MRGVRLEGVCNQRRESSGRVAREFGIPRVFGNWGDMIEDDDIDAVVIGAWPYLHGPITLAALDAGKHVLTQSRMAMNAREAQRMLDKSLEFPTLDRRWSCLALMGLIGDKFWSARWSPTATSALLHEVHVTGFSERPGRPVERRWAGGR